MCPPLHCCASAGPSCLAASFAGALNCVCARPGYFKPEDVLHSLDGELVEMINELVKKARTWLSQELRPILATADRLAEDLRPPDPVLKLNGGALYQPPPSNPAHQKRCLVQLQTYLLQTCPEASGVFSTLQFTQKDEEALVDRKIAQSSEQKCAREIIVNLWGLAKLRCRHPSTARCVGGGNVSAPGTRRASFVTRALPVDCCR